MTSWRLGSICAFSWSTRLPQTYCTSCRRTSTLRRRCSSIRRRTGRAWTRCWSRRWAGSTSCCRPSDRACRTSVKPSRDSSLCPPNWKKSSAAWWRWRSCVTKSVGGLRLRRASPAVIQARSQIHSGVGTHWRPYRQPFILNLHVSV